MGNQLEIPLLPEERWWGGRVGDGLLMPFGKATELQVDLSANLNSNQGSPLLLSDKGRFVWSERAFTFAFKEGLLSITGESDLEFGDGFKSLSDVYRYVSRSYFPPSGTYPNRLFFTAPQYNLFMEVQYEPTQEKVMAYAKAVLDNGMAPGVLMIDGYWSESYGTWEFHSGRFPDPEVMVSELHSMGFKVMLWVCPYVTPDTRTFRKLEEKGYFIKDKAGRPAIRRWWNGYSAVLDFTNEEATAWFHEQLGDLQTRYGIDGFKLDAGDPRFYSLDDVSAKPATRNDHCEAWARIGLHYSLNELRCCWKLGGQPLVQRLKDKGHKWAPNGLAALIPHALVQGLLGYPYTCPDMIGGGQINGFPNAEGLDQELIVRYAQCSALFPMMQFSVAPWRVLNKENLTYCIEAARLHTELGEEILEMVKDSAQTGEPILRHMAYSYPEEEGYGDINNQFMLGDSILVAPVLDKGARTRMIHFPSGTWKGDDGSIVIGPCVQEVEAPLSRLPWYRKSTE